MTGSEHIDGLQAKMADRKNRWKPPGTKQTSRSRRGRPAPRPRSGPPRRIPSGSAASIRAESCCSCHRKAETSPCRTSIDHHSATIAMVVRAGEPQHLPTQPEPLSAAIWPTATARHCGRFHVTAGTTAGVSVIEPTGQQAITESDCRPTAFLVKRRLSLNRRGLIAMPVAWAMACRLSLLGSGSSSVRPGMATRKRVHVLLARSSGGPILCGCPCG